MWQGREKIIVPKFNSLVAFYVPRQHKVTKVISEKIRYSLFGWFMEPENNNTEMEMK
jgi:Rps23 Pro-64 3,4-dihydroxylase Tpa1-like proline 4-hydroxylase